MLCRRKDVQAIEKEFVFRREQIDAAAKLVGNRVNTRRQLIGLGKPCRQGCFRRKIRRFEGGRDLVEGHGAILSNRSDLCEVEGWGVHIHSTNGGARKAA